MPRVSLNLVNVIARKLGLVLFVHASNSRGLEFTYIVPS